MVIGCIWVVSSMIGQKDFDSQEPVAIEGAER